MRNSMAAPNPPTVETLAYAWVPYGILMVPDLARGILR